MKRAPSRGRRVHLRGVPCGTDGRRWSSCDITTNADPARVTCARCRRIVAKAGGVQLRLAG